MAVWDWLLQGIQGAGKGIGQGLEWAGNRNWEANMQQKLGPGWEDRLNFQQEGRDFERDRMDFQRGRQDFQESRRPLLTKLDQISLERGRNTKRISELNLGEEEAERGAMERIGSEIQASKASVGDVNSAETPLDAYQYDLRARQREREKEREERAVKVGERGEAREEHEVTMRPLRRRGQELSNRNRELGIEEAEGEAQIASDYDLLGLNEKGLDQVQFSPGQGIASHIRSQAAQQGMAGLDKEESQLIMGEFGKAAAMGHSALSSRIIQGVSPRVMQAIRFSRSTGNPPWQTPAGSVGGEGYVPPELSPEELESLRAVVRMHKARNIPASQHSQEFREIVEYLSGLHTRR